MSATSQVSSEEFKNYLRSEGANCIEIGNVNDFTGRNRVWYGIDKVVQRAVFVDDMNIYTLDESKTNLNRVLNPEYLVIAVVFGLLLVLYYKVILYIIFGSKKEAN